MPWHNDDARVGQRLVHCLSRLSKGSRALASAEQQRRHQETPEPLRIEPVGFDSSQFPRDRVRRGNSRLPRRSEEHTSELQSRQYIVCRLLLEKKKKT